MSKKWLPYILIVPGIILITAIIFIPFLRNVGYSFTNYKLSNPDYHFIGLQNYVDALMKGDLFDALRHSLVWVIFNIILMLFFGVLAAFIQNSKHIRGVFVFQIFLMIPWVLPEAVTGYIWKLLLNYQSGIYYQLLVRLHLIPSNYDIFAHDIPAMFACIFANVWRSFPIVAMTVFAKLKTISMDQMEAAIIDGADRMNLFRYIELPHIRPVIISVGTLCFIWTFNAFGIIDVMTGGGPARGTETLPVFLQREAFQYFNYAKAASYAVIMLIILISIVTVGNLLQRRREKDDGQEMR